MKKLNSEWALLLALLMACLLAGCAASRSPLTGAFNRQVEKNYGADKTTVCFLFRHQSQMHGFDTIPKLNVYGVKDFNNLFREALPEITNIGSYTTFTESPADVDEPKRREELSKMRAENDYTLKIDFSRGNIIQAAILQRHHQPSDPDRTAHALLVGLYDQCRTLRPQRTPAAQLPAQGNAQQLGGDIPDLRLPVPPAGGQARSDILRGAARHFPADRSGESTQKVRLHGRVRHGCPHTGSTRGQAPAKGEHTHGQGRTRPAVG